MNRSSLYLYLGLLALLHAGCMPAIVPEYTPPGGDVSDDDSTLTDDDVTQDDDTTPIGDDDTSGDDDSTPTDADLDGYAVDSDCNDADPAINPGAVEICDGLDNDCSGTADDVNDNIWYLDADLDSYGGETAVVDGCEIKTQGPGQWVTQTGDCDDDNVDINPAAIEMCNGFDDDCDGTTDVGAIDALIWYEDLDGDGQGSDVTENACEAPGGFVDETGDCVDTDPRVFIGSSEICDGLDNDCDSVVDEAYGNPDVLTLWDDDDADGFGDDSAGSFVSCPADGFVLQGGDCDDTDGNISPEADEVCDGLDNDCDGEIDPDWIADASLWVIDSDGDGYGFYDVSTNVESCDQPMGYVANTTDCNDLDNAVNPAVTEVCNGIDDDCDGTIDVGAADVSTWYPDTDGDAFGNASGIVVTQCDQPMGYVQDATDCDDGDAWTFPGAFEECDGEDQDCDGVVDDGAIGDPTYTDADGDGYGYGGVPSFDCAPPGGNVDNNDDCDDADSSVFPDATEYCDTQDNDCDGNVDEEIGDVYYADTDGDGWGDPEVLQESCSYLDGFVSQGGDCDDSESNVNPGAIEVCADGVDNDCDEDVDSSPCVTEGDYEGHFVIILIERTYELGSDSCEGTASLTVSTTADPMISGTVECAFVGSVSDYFAGTFTGDVEGDFDGDLVPSGSIDFPSFDWGFDWDDNVSDGDSVNGEFDGSDTYEVYGIPLGFDYFGDFHADYIP